MKGRCRNCETELPMDDNTSCPECHSGDPFAIAEIKEDIENYRKFIMGLWWKWAGGFIAMLIALSMKIPGAELFAVGFIGYILYIMFEFYFKKVKSLYPKFDIAFECAQDEDAQRKISNIVKDATKRLYIASWMDYENDKLITK